MSDETTTDPTAIETSKPVKGSKAVADELARERQRSTELELQVNTLTADRDAVTAQLETMRARSAAAAERPEARGVAALERLARATEASALLTLSTRAHTAGRGRVAEEALDRAHRLLKPEE